MDCPWCPASAAPRVLHRHLLEEHADRVLLTARGAQARYELDCPVCGTRLHRAVKPFAASPEFLEEHREQVLLVAFDVLVHHLVISHPSGDQSVAGSS